jgi:hypothetical protein
MYLVRFVFALVVIVGGALMLADSVLGSLQGTTLFFEGVNHSFETIVGLVTLVVGASLIPSKPRPTVASA